MADISTWSPTDESNTAAPPAGWPENMQPSAVNNSARGMMGAIRRWYDTVTAQLASLTTSLGNYLPLTGGTLTGTLSAPAYNIVSVPFAISDGTTTSIKDPAGGSAIQLQAATNFYDADTHLFRNNSAVNMAAIDNAGNLTLNSNYIHFAGSSGTVNAIGGPLIAADTNNHIYKLGSGNGAFFFQNYAGANVASINAGGSIAAGSVNTTGTITAGGNITAPAFIGNVTVPASGPISTGGTVTGGTVNSTGNITATGGITAGGFVSAPGYQTRAGTAGAFTGNYFNIEWRPGAHLWIDNADQGTFVLQTGGTVNLTNLNVAGTIYSNDVPFLRADPHDTGGFNQIYDNTGVESIGLGNPGALINLHSQSTHTFRQRIEFGAANYAQFNASGTYNQSGSWGIVSDAETKDDITSYDRGLDAILALKPVSYRYKAGTPFADPNRTIRYGLVAQEVEPVIPEMIGEGMFRVGETEVSHRTMSPGHLVYVLVNAARELAAQNAALMARVAALEENANV